jgi:hypothetical protein
MNNLEPFLKQSTVNHLFSWKSLQAPFHNYVFLSINAQPGAISEYFNGPGLTF